MLGSVHTYGIFYDPSRFIAALPLSSTVAFKDRLSDTISYLYVLVAVLVLFPGLLPTT